MSTRRAPGHHAANGCEVPPVSTFGTHIQDAYRPAPLLLMSARTVSHARTHWAGVVRSESPTDQGYWPETLNSCANVKITGWADAFMSWPSDASQPAQEPVPRGPQSRASLRPMRTIEG